jgi:hypothetical protein
MEELAHARRERFATNRARRKARELRDPVEGHVAKRERGERARERRLEERRAEPLLFVRSTVRARQPRGHVDGICARAGAHDLAEGCERSEASASSKHCAAKFK